MVTSRHLPFRTHFEFRKDRLFVFRHIDELRKGFWPKDEERRQINDSGRNNELHRWNGVDRL